MNEDLIGDQLFESGLGGMYDLDHSKSGVIDDVDRFELGRVTLCSDTDALLDSIEAQLESMQAERWRGRKPNLEHAL